MSQNNIRKFFVTTANESDVQSNVFKLSLFLNLTVGKITWVCLNLNFKYFVS